MPNCFCVDRKLPLAMLPDKHRTKTAKAIDAQDARARRASESSARKVQAAVDGGYKQLRDKLGARNLAALRDARERERRAMRMLREPPSGLGLDRAKASKACKRRVDAAARELGIDPSVLRAIGKATGDRIDAAMSSPAGTVTPGFHLLDNLAKWQKLSPLHKYPLDVGVRPPLDPSPNAFQVFGPDFSLWNIAFDSVESDNFRVRREYTLYEHAGAIGNIATMDCDDADGWDLASAQIDTELVFVYTAPRSGRLEVIIDAMNTFGHHDLTIEDEFGFSNHWTHQFNYLSLNVFHPNIAERSLALLSQFDAEGNEDRTWSVRALTPGTHYYAHLLTDGTVQAGDTFFVGVGTRTFDKTRADDVEVHSRSNFQWLIRSAEVRVVP